MTSGILQDNSHFRMIDRSGKIIIKKNIPGEKKSSLSLNKCMISKEIMKHYFLMITVQRRVLKASVIVHIINHG